MFFRENNINLMLSVPLDRGHQLNRSTSSYEDQDVDSRKLIATIDQQKRTIRKLKLKIEKLEDNLRKQKNQQTSLKSDTSSHCQKNTHFQMLKHEIEKSGILQGNLFKIVNKIDSITDQISPNLETQDLSSIIPRYHSSEDFDSNPQQKYNHDFETFLMIQRAFNHLELLESTINNMKVMISSLKKDNATLKVAIHKQRQLRKKKTLDFEELKDIREQFQNERRRSAKLKKLLQKSEYQRNHMLNSIDSISTVQSQGKSPQELLKISKKLSLQVQILQKQKKAILIDNDQQKASWVQKYKQFLKILKQIKKK